VMTLCAFSKLLGYLGYQTNRFGMEAAQRGIAQGNTMFGQQNQLHQQGIQDILQQRQANLGQVQGLMGLGQQMGVPQFNQFQSTGAYQTPDLMGAAQGNYNAQMDKSNAKNSDSNRNLQTVGTAVGIAAALGF
jgi:hypothetical protein